MIFSDGPGVEPVPNYTRDIKQGIARWDAFVACRTPIYSPRSLHRAGSSFLHHSASTPTMLGFELKDANGYLLYFGHLREQGPQLNRYGSYGDSA